MPPFTISNLGMYHVTSSQAIIVPPHTSDFSLVGSFTDRVSSSTAAWLFVHDDADASL